MVSTIGIKVDAPRRRVLAADTRLKQSGLDLFDLDTGALRHRVDLSAVPGGATGIHGANDVDPDGRASLLLARPDLLGDNGVGPNGIVWHPGGSCSWCATTSARCCDATPTTATVTRYGTYVLDGRLPDLFGGSPTDGFTIRRL